MSARGEEVTEDVFSRCEQVAELPDGYAFRFPGGDEWAAELLHFALEERKCCPFFVFEIRFDPQEGPIWLHLRGSENVKLFVQQTFKVAAEGAAPALKENP